LPLSSSSQCRLRERFTARQNQPPSPGQPLTDYQIDNLIFEPGFSTADKITDVSGRGVGMDVVKKALDAMRGKIEVFSTEGKEGCRKGLMIDD